MNHDSTKTTSSMGLIPFNISFGVTGHRSLPDSNQIAERIREIFQGRFRECFDQQTSSLLLQVRATPIAFTVVTALATGADQLVARIAMEHQARIDAVLPFAKDEYRKDFAPEQLVHFNDLLQRAKRCIQLEGDVPGAGDPEEARREGYLMAGKYVVEHCDILIAIWDGDPARGKGGTAEIVALARERKKPTFIISTKPPYGTILRNGGQLQGHNLQPLDEFNSFSLTDSEINKRAEEDLAGIYNDQSCREIPGWLKQEVSERLLPCYARASIVAEANQKLYQMTAIKAYVITTVAVFLLASAVVCHELQEVSSIMFCLELVALLYLLWKVHHAQKDQVHRKWLEYRSMAERLRIAFFFVSCGVRPIMFSDTGRLLIDIERRDWVSAAFESILEELPIIPASANKACSCFGKHICARWIESQKDYHGRKAQKAEQKNKLLNKVRNSLFLGAVFSSIIHIIIRLLQTEKLAVFLSTIHNIVRLLQANPWIEDAVSVIAITLPVAGAAVEGFRTLMEYPRIASRCNAMKTYLEQLSDQSRKLTSHRELSSLLAKTEKLMLIESHDWIKLLRFADLEKVL